MKPLLNWFNHLFEATPNKIRPFRWQIILLFLLATGFMTYGVIVHFKADMTLESWFAEGDPTKVALDNFRSEFGSDDGLYIVFSTKDNNVFSYQSLSLLDELVEDLKNPVGIEGIKNDTILHRIVKVTALTNSRYLIANEDDLISKTIITGEVPSTTPQLDAIKQLALSQENFIGAFFSKDDAYGGLQIKTDFGAVLKKTTHDSHDSELLLIDDGGDIEDEFSMTVDTTVEPQSLEFVAVEMEEYMAMMEDLYKILHQPKYAEHFKFYPVGTAAMMNFAMETMAQTGLLLMVMLFIIFGLLWTLLKSFSAVIWSVVVMLSSMIWTIGTAAWLGVEVSSMVSLTAMLIITVSVADCVHVMSTYLYYRKQNLSHEAALTKTYRKTGMAIMVTTLTTMSGMLALTITGMQQFVVFGIMSGLGVVMAWLITWIVLPMCLDIWHPISSKAPAKKDTKTSGIGWFFSAGWLQGLLDKIPDLVRPRPLAITGIFVLLFAVFIYGTAQVKVDTNFIELSKEGSPIRVAYELVDEKLMGAQNMEIMIDFAMDDALKNATVLQAIDQFETHILTQYPEYVQKTFSLAGLLKDTYRVMNAGHQDYYRIPDNDKLAGQLLFLFSNSNPEDRRLMVNDSFSKSHISLQMKNKGSYEYREFFDSIRVDIDRIFSPLKQHYPDMQVTTTGGLAMMMELSQGMAEAQLKSFVFAIIIISILMIITLGSVQGGLLSILPNIIPAIFTFGMMGLLGVPLDTDTLIIAPLIIGIAVDDTIHFITHYRDAWLHSGNLEQALKSTVKEVGQAITFTSLILGVGFFTLSFSDYGGMAKMGTFGSMAIFVALACDLLLFPALIYLFKPKFGRKDSVQTPVSA